MSKKKKPKKRTRYSQYSGEFIDFDGCLSQASYILDLAGTIATENNNVDQLIKLANSWSALGNSLFSDVDSNKVNISEPYGFIGNVSTAGGEEDE